MDVVLVTLTAISLSVAIGMGVVLLKTLREERQRADARVALLAAAAATTRPLSPSVRHPLSPARSHLSDDRIVGDLFTVSEEVSPWPRRAGVAAVLAGIVALGGYALLHAGRAPAAAPAAAPMPLELLALDHVQEAGAFTVSGTVRNPQSGTTMSDVGVTALLFDAEGTLVANGRAGLDFRTLAPGDASPFVVKVPVNASVSRYRVGFRAPDGTVVSHVDRRTEPASARAAANAGGTPWGR
jgi:hypothetical protein